MSANELDALYHEFTDFDSNGETAKRFVDVLKQAADVLVAAYVLRHIKPQERIKLKVRRLDVTALIMFPQDVSKNPLFKLDVGALAARLAKAESEDRPGGKSTSGSTLQTYYEWWRTKSRAMKASGSIHGGHSMTSRKIKSEQGMGDVVRYATRKCHRSMLSSIISPSRIVTEAERRP